MDTIVDDMFSLMEALCNFTMYANVGRVTSELLLNNRKFSVSIHTTTNGHFQRLSDRETTLGCPLSHCVTAVVLCCFSLVERL